MAKTEQVRESGWGDLQDVRSKRILARISNRAIKVLDGILGRGVMACLGAHDWVRRLINPRYRVGDESWENVRTVLASKLCCLGDGVLAVPALRGLRRRWPEAFLLVLCTPRTEAVFSDLPFVDKTVVLPITGLGGPWEIARHAVAMVGTLLELRRHGPQVAVDLDLYFKATPVISYLSGAAVRAGFDIEGYGRAGLFTHTVPRHESKWEAECFLDVVAALGARDADTRLEFAVSERARAEAAQVLGSHQLAGTEFVAFCPGSSKNWPAKQWPGDRFAAVIDWLGREYGMGAVLIGADFERRLCEAVAEGTDGKVVNLAGRLTVPQLAAVLQQAEALVTNDTGPLHVATAVGTPVVAIFGPTDERKWGPRGLNDSVVVASECTCRPCYYLSRMPECGERECLLQIEPRDVIERLEAILRSRSKRGMAEPG